MNFSSMSTFMLFHWNSCHQVLLLPNSKLMAFQNFIPLCFASWISAEDDLLKRWNYPDLIWFEWFSQLFVIALGDVLEIYVVVTFLYMLTIPINLKMLWESFNTKLKIGSIKTRRNRSHLEGNWKFIITTTRSTISYGGWAQGPGWLQTEARVVTLIWKKKNFITYKFKKFYDFLYLKKNLWLS